MKVVTPRGGPPGAPGMDGSSGQRGSGVLNIAGKAANMFAPHLGIGDAIKSGPAGMLRQIAGKLTSPHRAMMKGMGQNMMANPMVQQMMQMPAVQGLMGEAKESFAGSPLSKVAEGMFGKDAVDGVMGSIGGAGAPGTDGATGPSGIMGVAVADISAGSPIMKTPKPPIGEAIKPLSPKSSSTVAYDSELMKIGAEAIDQGGLGGANTRDIPTIDAASKISANKIAVLGITV